ncbi:MAG: LamG-like jellyroll fold domain-containing protein [Pirellulales bacterium]
MNRMTPSPTAQLCFILALVCCPPAGLLAAHGADESDASAPPSEADSERHFETQIAPLLARHCLECHASTSKKGGLDLSRKDPALAGGTSGSAIVPGQSAESLLWQYVESDEMPKDRPPLPEREKRLLREWIEAGAAWSLDAIDLPAAPNTRGGGSNWVRRLTVPEYIETVKAAVGVDVGEEARRIFPPDMRADGFSNTAYNLSVDLAHVEAYATLAQIVVARMELAKFAAQYSERQDPADAGMRELISRMGKWLLRGPLDEREIDSYLALSKAVADEGGDYAEAVGYIVEAMLQSPRFVYRIEDQRGDGTARPLGEYELASRLSYILWGGPPDKELMRAADSGELSDRRRVAAQVQRMLRDPRAVERSAQFLSEWMHLDRLFHLRPRSERFPGWNDQLATDMREETLAFFKYVAWEQNRPLSDLMNAQVTFATPRLARHYGFKQKPADAGSGGREVVRAPERVARGLQVLYTFGEGSGDVVRDVSTSGEPMHLKIADSAAAQWNDQGLLISKPTLIASEQPPARLIDSLKNSKAITLEAWITPANASQTGPARVVTLSDGISSRNFTLGQLGDRFDVRLRTTAASGNGEPSLSSPAGTAAAVPLHVVYTRDAAGKTTIYVNGKKEGEHDVGGDFSNWDGGFRLALANELSRDRTWAGTLHLVAVYDRALSAEETRQNWAAGAQKQGLPALASAVPEGQRSSEGLQALYLFDEGGGSMIRDTADAGEPLDLNAQDASQLEWGSEGITVKGPTLITTSGPATRLIDEIKKSRAVTLEVWITPGDTTQSGPARILTLSSGPNQRNFTIGQDGDKYEVRFRAEGTDLNGMPGLSSPSGSARTQRTHLAFTRDAAGNARLYLDGEEQGERALGGDLANWDDGFHLSLANESTKDRAWRGLLHRVAIYSRALTPQEIRYRGDLRPDGGDLARYDLADVPGRGGLLTQASVLTIGGDEASMVTRGLFVLRELLYGGVEDPPPCVDTTPVPTKPGLSQRAVAMDRLANQSCTGCHSKFEPLAFGLEKFDGIGAYHDVDEHGNELRDDGQILFPDQDQPIAYKSSAELMNLLAGSERVRMAITRKVAQFALGRPLVDADEPFLDEIHQAAENGGGTYASLITAIVMSDLVQMTRTETDP